MKMRKPGSLQPAATGVQLIAASACVAASGGCCYSDVNCQHKILRVAAAADVAAGLASVAVGSVEQQRAGGSVAMMELCCWYLNLLPMACWSLHYGTVSSWEPRNPATDSCCADVHDCTHYYSVDQSLLLMPQPNLA